MIRLASEFALALVRVPLRLLHILIGGNDMKLTPGEVVQVLAKLFGRVGEQLDTTDGLTKNEMLALVPELLNDLMKEYAD